MPRLKTIKEFEEWVKDEANVEDLLRRVAEGTKLQKACLDLKRPYTLVYPYLHSTDELKKRYEAALAARADALMHETVEIADSVRKTDKPARVMAAKLAVETRQAIASGWNRERYGETLRVERPPQAPGDDRLLGFASELLKLVKAAEPRVIEQELEALPAPEKG